MTAPVGTAYLMARVTTTKVKGDLKNAFKEAWKDVKEDAEKEGALAGKRFQKGFKTGLGNAKLSSAMSGVWKEVKDEAEAQGALTGKKFQKGFKTGLATARLSSAMRGAWAELKDDAEKQGFQAGKRFQRGFKAGMADAKLTNAMQSAWGEVRKAAGEEGEKSGDAYAKAFNKKVKQTRKDANSGGGGGDDGGGGGTGGGGGRGGRRGGSDDDAVEAETKKLVNPKNAIKWVDVKMRFDTRSSKVLMGSLNLVKSSLQGIAMLSAAALAAFAGQAAISGIMGMVGGLGQMSGILLAMPALVAAIGLPVATVMMGVHGIGEAFKAAGTRSQDAAAASKAVEAAQEGVASAQDRVNQAEKNATQAAKSHERARDAVAEAIKNQIEKLEDLNLELKGSALDEEDALIGVERAKERLAKMPADSTALDYREANLGLKQSVQRLEEVREGNDDLRQEVTKANAEGVEGSKSVKDARDAEAEAADKVAEANKGIVDALHDLDKANKNLAEAGKGADKFGDAMKKLSPAAADFVNQMLGLGPAFSDMQKMVQQNLFKKLGDDVSNLARVNMPVLQANLGVMSQSLNGMARDVIKAFAAPDAVDKFAHVLGNVNNAIDLIRPGIFALMGVFKNLSTVGSEFLPGFASGFSDGAKKLETWTQDFDHMRDIMQNAVNVMKQFWEILKNAGGLIMAVFDGAPVERILNDINGLVDGLKKTAESAEGQKALATFWENGAKALEAIGPLVSSLALGLVDVGGMLAGLGANIAPGAVDFINALKTGIDNMKPLFEQAGPVISELFSNLAVVLPPLGKALNDIGIAFLPVIDNIGELIRNIGPPLMDFFSWLSPALPAIAGGVIGLALAWKGFSLAEKGISTVTDTVKGALGKQTEETKKKTQASKLLGGAIKGVKKVEEGFRKGVGLMGKGLKALGGPLKSAAMGIRAVGVAIMTNPIGIIIVALVAVGAAFYLLYTKCEWFRDAVQKVWEAIKSGADWIWDKIKAFVGWIVDAFQGIIDWAKDHWQLIIEIITGPIGIMVGLVVSHWDTIKNAFMVALQAIGDFFVWIWDNAIKPAWDGLGAGITWVWENVIKKAWDAIWAGLQAIGDFFGWVWNSLIKPAWEGLGDGINWVWENVIKVAWDGLQISLQALGDFFKWIWESVIKPAWSALGDGINWVWENVIKKSWDALTDALGKVGGFFETVVGGIKTAWDKIMEIARKPIFFVVDTVINGLIDGFNVIADKIPVVPHIERINVDKLRDVPAAATGGIMSGYSPGRDDRLIAVGGGEAIMRPEWTRAVGPDYVNEANRRARTGGVSGIRKFVGEFASGGLVTAEGGGSTAIWETLWNAAHTAFPNATLNSALDTTPGRGIYHEKGQAVDLGGPKQQIADWIFGTYPDSAQLIWDAGPVLLNSALTGRVPRGDQAGIRAAYGEATMAQHQDHVHWGSDGPITSDGKMISMMIGEGSAPISGGGGSRWNPRTWAAGAFDKAMGFLRAVIDKAIPDLGEGMLKDAPLKAFDHVRVKMKDWISGHVSNSGPGSASNDMTGQKFTGPDMVPIAQNSDGTWSSPNSAWAHLIARESGGNPSIVQGIVDVNTGGNEASGLFQIAKGTWASNGGLDYGPTAGESAPEDQARVAARIFKQQGGSPWGSGLSGREQDEELAKFSRGGLVPAFKRGGLMPKLYDQGGKLPPGLTLVMNKTGRDELVLNDQQKTQLEQGRGVGGLSDGGLTLDFGFANDEFAKKDLGKSFQDLGVNALKEISGDIFKPLGIDGIIDKIVDQVVTDLRKQQEDDRQREEANKGTGDQPPAPAGTQQVAGTIVFNGVDVPKAMDELHRFITQGMAPISRYRGGV